MSSLFASLIDGNHVIIPYFWFLQVIFTLLLAGYFLLLLQRKTRISDAAFYVLAVIFFGFIPWFCPVEVSWFSLYNTCCNALYFFIGMAYARYSKGVDRVIKWSSPVVTVVLCLLWIGAFEVWKDSDWFFICSLLGIAMTVSVSRLLEERHIALLDHLTGAYYLIFLLSWYFNVFFQQVLSHFTHFPWWTYSMLSLIAGLYIPLFIYRYILRYPSGKVAVFARRFLGQ